MEKYNNKIDFLHDVLTTASEKNIKRVEIDAAVLNGNFAIRMYSINIKKKGLSTISFMEYTNE